MSNRLLLVAFSDAEADSSIGFVQALGLPTDFLVFSTGEVQNLPCEKLYRMEVASLPPADATASEIAKLGRDYSHVAAVSSMRAKDVLARVAGILDSVAITDCTAVLSPTTFERPIVAGSIIATVELLEGPAVMTFRPAGFPVQPFHAAPDIQTLEFSAVSKVVVTAQSAGGGARPDLAQAKVVVSGGRPLKDAQTFERLIGGLADSFGGAVGATRAAVDSGIAPNELQVGQTGKIVAPDLYIAAGISGSTQHMAGIKDSKLIVAINKDPDAPIFGAADLGIVADLFDVVPALTDAIWLIQERTARSSQLCGAIHGRLRGRSRRAYHAAIGI